MKTINAHEIGLLSYASTEFRWFVIMDIQTKRIYEAAGKDDGYRVLVDRLWPRGMTKEQAKADLWLKEVAPSSALRQWFNHDPSKWEAFKSQYFLELDGKQEEVMNLIEKGRQSRLTLLFSAKNPEFNQATALKEYLISRAKENVV